MIHSLATPEELKSGIVKANHFVYTEEEASELKTRLKKDLRELQVDRFYRDPEQLNQNVGLFSFCPSPGAMPDKDGFYGFAKIRGVYCNEEDANNRADYLIKTCDSYHQIFNCEIGAPFPLISNANDGEKFAETVKRVDIKTKAAEVISENIIKKRNEAKEELRNIRQKEQQLIEESKRVRKGELDDDPFEVYITQQVKRAHLIYGYEDLIKKLKEIKFSYINTTKLINELEETNPEFLESYRKKYYEARDNAGINDDNEGFIKYLGMDKIKDIEWNNIKLD